ncbi:MAG TPA: 2-succinyl-5-enolpyruvyl-6-hydroxy-3-cyclohexene-1-carboxylic-acid synthase [Bacillota bacterium]
MNDTERLTRYTANFIDELAKSGVTDVVISPGSRSTPLAMTVCEHENLKEWVIIDERSAGFFALGLAKQSQQPVALVCTSGTAAANYYPAIVEAHYSRVPLLVLTADRPHELRGVGAPQAIEQINMYGEYAKWFHEMALPDATPHMLKYVRSKAARAVHVAKEGNSGVVHLNFPFREPLVPNFSFDNVWGEEMPFSYHPTYDGVKRIHESQLTELIESLHSKKRGILVCGPLMDINIAEAITQLARAWELPIIADPLSQIRSGNHPKDNIIESYDAFLRNETIRKKLQPDFIIRFGAMPISKSYLHYVQTHEQALQFVVEQTEGYRDPTAHATSFIYADPLHLCHDLLEQSSGIQCDSKWLHTWQQMNEMTKEHLQMETNHQLTEGQAARGLLEVIPNGSGLYVGNSMAIRDIDTFFLCTSKKLKVLANRGANGIDGVTSSALGAAATGKPMTLLIGDLSFYHDFNSLLAAKHYELDIVIVLINNNGGGIFSFLPQSSDDKYFEVLFGTPLHLEFQKGIEMYGGTYRQVITEDDFKKALENSYCERGLSVIEVKTDRTKNVKWHRDIWDAINEEILKNEGTIWNL